MPTATAAPDAEAEIGELNPQATGRLCNKRVDAEVNLVISTERSFAKIVDPQPTRSCLTLRGCELRQCSVSRQWPRAGELTLPVIKQSLGKTSDAGSKVGSVKYSGRSSPASLPGDRQRPHPHDLDLRYRPGPDTRPIELVAAKQPFSPLRLLLSRAKEATTLGTLRGAGPGLRYRSGQGI